MWVFQAGPLAAVQRSTFNVRSTTTLAGFHRTVAPSHTVVLYNSSFFQVFTRANQIETLVYE